MAEGNIDELLVRTGALLQGHFRLTSGRHSPSYIEKFRIMEDPLATTMLCRMIAGRFRDAGISVVVGPATGGIILAYETARQLGTRAIFAEKGPEGGLIFDRGFAVAPNERTLVVDDVLTTGGSVRQVLSLLREARADIAGIGFLIDRTNGGVDFGLPLFACHSMTIESYDPADCPLCRQGLPLVET
jgi:orotate phosphoribosyltransferase